jgi:antitoxin (DNA-binding transcriptional repressor) of toxin-antitoxin stability system
VQKFVVGVAELKSNLSDHLGKVAASGESLLVTDHGSPMVRIVAIPVREEPALLERLGIVKAPDSPGLSADFWARLRATWESAG